jgi:chemotaxis signal transduction protein
VSRGAAFGRSGERSSAELRREFDEAFALPARTQAQELEDLLAIRVGPDGYAIRSRELSGIAAIRKISPLPSRMPELLGLVGVRGVLVPVFGLAGLLGYDPGPEPVRWLALVGREEPIALAFHALEGYRTVAKSAFSAESGAGDSPVETVTLEQRVRSVIRVPSLVATLEGRFDNNTGRKRE